MALCACVCGCAGHERRPHPSIVALPPASADRSDAASAQGDEPIVNEEIRVPPCGFWETVVGLETQWGRFGKRPFLESDAGERLELECIQPLSSTYRLWYESGRTGRVLVGECPFEGGCNYASFQHSGDLDGNGRPDRILATRWVSKDYGFEDGNGWYDDDHPGRDGLLDHAEFRFDASRGELELIVHKFEYRPSSFNLSCKEHGEASDTPVKSFLVKGWTSTMPLGR